MVRPTILLVGRLCLDLGYYDRSHEAERESCRRSRGD